MMAGDRVLPPGRTEETGSQGEIVPLGKYYKAQKNGEKVK